MKQEFITDDDKLLAIALKRMAHLNPQTLITQTQVDKEFGFSLSDYENTNDVEFEQYLDIKMARTSCIKDILALLLLFTFFFSAGADAF